MANDLQSQNENCWFAAGFIDNQVGKVVCTDSNMAAAGGNNWSWDVVHLYNPDFRLDAKLRADLDAGKLSKPFLDAFNASGASLSNDTTVSAGQCGVCRMQANAYRA